MSYVVKYVQVNMYNVVLHLGWIVLAAEGGLVIKYRCPLISIFRTWMSSRRYFWIFVI